jgi:hypothetical protein
MLQTFKNWWSNWRAGRAPGLGLDGCSPFEIEQMACDLGMSSSELRMVAGSRGNDLLFSRLQGAGIEPGLIDPRVLRDMQRCCAHCESEALCEHELQDRPIAAKWPSYCPNQPTIEALLAVRRH